jgi:hypothetical protein
MNKIFAQGSGILLSLSLLFGACTDDKLKVGLELLPDSDQIVMAGDTINVSCYTYKGLPADVNSSNSASDNYPLGQFIDPVFGETAADVVMEFEYNPDTHYGNDSITSTDSAVAVIMYFETTDLPINGTIEDLDMDAFLLDGRFSFGGKTNTNVPSDNIKNSKSYVINTTHNFITTSHDIPGVDSGKYYMKLEMDMELADILMQADYENDVEYFNAFSGFLFRGKANNGSMGALQNIYPNKANLVLSYNRRYLTEVTDTAGETSEIEVDTLLHTNFYPSKDFVKHQYVYRFAHMGSDAEIESVFRDTTIEYDNFYLQSLGGTRALVDLNYLEAFKQQKQDSIAINLAELILPIDKSYLSDTNYADLPKRIVVYALEDESTELIPLFDDATQLGAIYFNGYLEEENFLYRVNISEFVSLYLGDDYLDKGIQITNLNISISEFNGAAPSIPEYKIPSRTVLHSGLSTNSDRAFIRVIYTNL